MNARCWVIAALWMLLPARNVDAEVSDTPDCRPRVIADRPGATTSPLVVRPGCWQLAQGTLLTVEADRSRYELPGLLRWGLLPRVEARFGLSPRVETTAGETKLRSPHLGIGAKLTIREGSPSIGLLGQVVVPASDEIASGAVPGARLLIEVPANESSVALNVGADSLPGPMTRYTAFVWAAGYSRAFVAGRLTLVVNTTGTAPLTDQVGYSHAVGAALAVLVVPTVQLDLGADVDIIGDTRAARIQLGVVTRL